MPATVKVKVVAGRNLPVMDRASEMADPFVEIKFGQVAYKTDIYQKSLNPFGTVTGIRLKLMMMKFKTIAYNFVTAESTNK